MNLSLCQLSQISYNKIKKTWRSEKKNSYKELKKKKMEERENEEKTPSQSISYQKNKIHFKKRWRRECEEKISS